MLSVPPVISAEATAYPVMLWIMRNARGDGEVSATVH
jgi:hypothetical protein